MGYGIDVTCNKCHYNKAFMLGIGGLAPYTYDGFIKGKRMQEEIKSNLEAGYTVSSQEYVLMRCDKCDGLFERFYVELENEECDIYRTEYKCSKCKKPLIKIDHEEISKYPCPDCHKKTLSQVMNLLWD